MSKPLFFDVHTHTHFAAFEGETDTVLARALEAGVWVVNVGTQKDTSAGAVETAARYAEGVYAAVGLHPIHTEKSYHDEKELGIMNHESGFGFISREESFDYEYYKKLALQEKVVAIGECGFDYFRLGEKTKKRQQNVFEQHIALAAEVKKPLMVHCRNAFDDLIKILQATSYKLQATSPGIVHFFTGSIEDARTLLNLGFFFSFGGVLTFARDYDEVLRFIPLDRIVSETDAPYVTPVPYRGKRNESLYVREVAKKIAEIKGKEHAMVALELVRNACRVFALPVCL
jgi:TatD DNase family protein